MVLNLPDDKVFWNEKVHLSGEPTITRANILKLIYKQGIEKMDKINEIKALAEKLQKLTGKTIMFQEAEGPGEIQTAPEPDVIDNATRFGNATSLFGALSKQLEAAIGVISAKQEQNPDSPALLGSIDVANKGLAQIVKALETPDAQQPVAEDEGRVSLHRMEELEEEILEVEGEPIQVYFPKGMRKKLRDRAKRAGKFTISDYIRSKIA